MSLIFPFSDPRDVEENPPLIIVEGDGICVIDADGKSYIDAASGLWCASLGFSNRRLAQVATEQMNKLPYYHSFMGRGVEPTIKLAEKVIALAPDSLKHVFFSCSGSEAVDLAVKMAWFYNNARGLPDKKRVISRVSGYHGSGVLSASLTGMGYCHDGFDMPGPFVLRTDRPNYDLDAEPGENQVAFSKRLARQLDAQIQREGAETIAAFIGEPVIGSGGAILPPDGYWAEIQDVLARHDILLIADEIITGFGRTGEMFGSNLYDLKPDMMTIAKQLSSAYSPISGTLISDEIYQTIADDAHQKQTFGHGITYGGHPVAAAVALETLKIYEEMDVCAVVKSLAVPLDAALTDLADLDSVARVRSVGLIGAIDLVPDAGADGAHGQRVAKAALEAGLLYRVVGDTIALAPPLIITPEEIAEIASRLKSAILSASK
jgi:4-aminobutyrate--pyruvate transaminase